MKILDIVKNNNANFKSVDIDNDGIQDLQFRECVDGHLWFVDEHNRDIAVNIEEYRNSDPPLCLWYETDGGFEFPIPFDDMKGGRFQATEKAITLMRWIRHEFETQDKA